MQLAPHIFDPSQITGMVLAGGASTRMRSLTDSKALLLWRGRPIISYVIEHLQPQVATVVINANTHLEQYAALGLPIWKDLLDPQWEAFPGPMAGMLTGLRNATTPWLATVPCDAPLLADDFVEKLYRRAMATHAKIVIASTQAEEKSADEFKDHPVFALLHRSLLHSLYHYLKGGDRKIMLWMQQHHFERVLFEDQRPFMVNINTAEAFEAFQLNNNMK